MQALPHWVTAFDSHWLFGYGLMMTSYVFHWTFWATIAWALLGFGIKEFYIDKHDETIHQTFLMNLGDFGGYCLGLLLGIGIWNLHLWLN